MMRIKSVHLTLAMLVLLGAGTMAAHGQGPELVTIKALMIQAQNDSAPIDRRLEKVEYKLRRVFGFQFYKYVDEGSVSLPSGGQGVIQLAQGYQLHVQLGGKGRNAEVRWLRENEALLSTSVKLSRDGPLVLGGVPSNGGKLILVLTVQ